MVHRFLRCVGLLNFDDFPSFREHIHNLAAQTIQEMCAAFADRLCASSNSARAYVRIFNIMFVDVFNVVPHRFIVPRRRHRIISISELDDMLSTTSSTIGGGSAGLPRTDHFTASETDQLISAAAQCGLRDHLMVTLLATTGLRRRGLLNIRTIDVAKLSENSNMEPHWDADVAGNTREKGGKTRSFPLFPNVQALIEKWLNTNEHNGGRPYGPSPYLFPSGTGDKGQLSVSAIGNAFRRVCQKAGLADHRAHLHAMRHSCAHRLLDSGNTPRQIAAYLGHSSASTTEKYYLRENPTDVTKKMHLPVEWKQSTGEMVSLEKVPVRDTLRELLNARRQRDNK